MKFDLKILKNVLQDIEESATFQSKDPLDSKKYLNTECKFNIPQYIETHKEREDDILYIIMLLKIFGYITINGKFITRIMPDGYKFMLNILYGINFSC